MVISVVVLRKLAVPAAGETHAWVSFFLHSHQRKEAVYGENLSVLSGSDFPTAK